MIIFAGIEYNLTPVSRITIEGFYKKYSQYPVSTIDGVSLANKGGGFEVLEMRLLHQMEKERVED